MDDTLCTLAPKMFRSLQAGKAVTIDSTNTIASGLAPPMAGGNNFEVIRNFVEDIILVSDEEIKRCVESRAISFGSNFVQVCHSVS